MIVRYKLNPAFVVMAIFFACVGYLIGGTRAAVWGAVIWFSISFTIAIIDFFVNINKTDAEKAMDELRRFYGKK